MPTSIVHLSDRGLLGLSGPDAKTFLQTMVTNSLSQLKPDQPLYAAHLTGQGRFLYDFFIIETPTHLLLDVARDQLMPLAKALHSYQVQNKVEYDDMSGDYSIYAIIGDDVDKKTITNGKIYADPRLNALGLRAVVPVNAPQPATNATLTDYHAHRIRLGVPDGQMDASPGKTILNEMCLADLHGIDYKKGCYVGQELTARTHFRTQPKKRLMQVTFNGIAPPLGTPVMRGGLEIGTLYSTTADGHGIAILRLSEVAKGEPLLAGNMQLTARKPDWATYTYPPSAADDNA
ncbi:MAG: folate-binding protein [Proteobacteria bacterium]|nr:folate-binding protein [Pseudomonadota bacterium]